jgi:hypothetical protein
MGGFPVRAGAAPNTHRHFAEAHSRKGATFSASRDWKRPYCSSGVAFQQQDKKISSLRHVFWVVRN